MVMVIVRAASWRGDDNWHQQACTNHHYVL